MKVAQTFGAVGVVVGVLFAGFASAAITFSDVSSSAGIAYSGPTFGASWGDFNGDGAPDLWVGNHYASTGPSLYLNNGDGTFRDIASTAWPGPVQDSHGAAWGDVDRDGDKDLIEVAGGDQPNRLWMNEAGRFIDRAAQWEATVPRSRARTPVWLDWNRDGYLDLALTEEQGPTVNAFALRNTGARFIDATSETNIALTSSQAAYLADLTGDNILDLASLSGGGALFPAALYDTAVTPFTLRPDLISAGGGISDVVFADFNGDLKTDYFATRGVGPQQLVVRSSTRIEFRMAVAKNENAVTFGAAMPVRIEVYPDVKLQNATYVGAGRGSEMIVPTPEIDYWSYQLTLDPTNPRVAGMPAHVAGVDEGLFIGFDPTLGRWTVALSGPRSQDVRFVVSSTGTIEDPQAIGFKATQTDPWPYYYLRTDTGFVERRSANGMGSGMPCFSAVAGDFDNDMDVDLYLACQRGVENVANILLENRGDGIFTKVAAIGDAAGSLSGRAESVVTADYDSDGFLDLFVTNGAGGGPFNSGPHQLLRNTGNANKWLEMDLVGRFSNPTGIGAVVKVTASGKTQLREQNGGVHNHAQNFERLHVGLGSNSVVDVIEVRWPSGIVQTLRNVPANQVLRVVETSTAACSDGLDNDGDGTIDFPADVYCATWSGTAESGPELIYQQGSGSNGLAVIEAEHFYAKAGQLTHNWVSDSRTGYSGEGAMLASPNIGVTKDVDFKASSPRLDFKVDFVKTGTHYVWIRGAGGSGDGSVHVGLDGNAASTSDRIAGFAGTAWKWLNATLDGPVATIVVATPGVHTVNVWMRDDGFDFDAMMLTINPAVVAGSGLTESYRYTNRAPTVSAVSDQSARESETVSLPVLAQDGDKDALRFSASGLPSGLAIDGAGGVISGVIAAGAAYSSPYAVTISVDDGSGTSTATTRTSFSWTVLPPAVDVTGSTLTYLQGAGTQGLVVIEAEHFNVKVNRGEHVWRSEYVTGYRGDGAMKALPNLGAVLDIGFDSTSPRMDFAINFVKTGTHYVWLRGLGANGGSTSAHVGLDGGATPTSDRITSFGAAWKWSNATLDGPVAAINITTAGLHTLNVWMRDDGFVLDAMVLTVNPTLVPGSGNVESYRY